MNTPAHVAASVLRWHDERGRGYGCWHYGRCVASRLADIRLLWESPSLGRKRRGMDLVEAMLSEQLAIALGFKSTGYCADVDGANIWGFKKVADAMLAYGIL